MIRFYKFLIIVLILSGCKDAAKTDPETNIKTENLKSDTNSINSKKEIILENTDTLLVKKDDDENIFEGIYVLNQNENIFTDCKNPDSTYWISDETKKLKCLYEKIYTSKNVYSAVYARLKGEIVNTVDRPGEYISEKYPKTIQVKEVIEIDKKNFRNTCLKYDFWAIGNEPGWSMQISKHENLIELTDLSEKKSYYFFYEEPKEEEGRIVYIAHNNIQQYIIDVFIKKEKCRDRVTGVEYDYSVEVELSGGKKYRGCAIKGKD